MILVKYLFPNYTPIAISKFLPINIGNKMKYNIIKVLGIIRQFCSETQLIF